MNPLLGDSFTKEYRISFCNRHLKPGAIFRAHVPHTTPPKVKRFIVIAINEAIFSMGLLFINSQVNPNLRNLNLFLTADQRTYLDNDSYLDCSRLYEWSLPLLRKKFVANPKIYLGHLCDTDMAKARQLVISAKTIERKLKQRYGFL